MGKDSDQLLRRRCRAVQRFCGAVPGLKELGSNLGVVLDHEEAHGEPNIRSIAAHMPEFIRSLTLGRQDQADLDNLLAGIGDCGAEAAPGETSLGE